jgi:hypothetical protein
MEDMLSSLLSHYESFSRGVTYNDEDIEQFLLLCQQLRVYRATTRGGSETSFEQYDAFGPLIWRRSKDNTSNNLMIEFKGIKEVEFVYTSYVTFDIEDRYIHPYDVTDEKFPSEYIDMVLEEASELGDPGNALSFGNTLFCLRCSDPERYLSNPILSRLKYYVRKVGGDYKMDHFRYVPKPVDTMFPYRVQTGINFAISLTDMIYSYDWCGSRLGSFELQRLLVEVYIEVFEFIFNDPMYNTALFKKATSIFLQSAFAGTRRGKTLRWEIDRDPRDGGQIRLTGCREVEIDSLSPDFIYLRRATIKEAISSSTTQLKELGLVYTLELLSSLLTAEFTEFNARTVMLVEHLQSLSGFTRTIPTLSHKDQVESGGEPVENPPYAPYLRNIWRDFWDFAFEQGGKVLMDDVEYKAQIPFMQTSRSAGGRDYSIPFEIKSEGEIHRYNASTKALHFLMNPEGSLDPVALLEGYTEEHPGVVATRDVTGGKKARAVMMQKHPRYNAEIPIAVPLAEYQIRTKDDQGHELMGIGNANDFHVGYDIGVTTFDHAWGLYASSDPKILIVDKDGSAFDAHQPYVSMRRIALSASLDAINEKGIDPLYSDWGMHLSELLQAVWGDRNVYNAVYISTSTTRREILVVDMLGSGELMTLSINNMTNIALSDALIKVIENALREEGKEFYFEVIKRRKMGDDSEEYVITDLTTPEDLEWIANMAEKVYKDNGHDLNIIKTSTRFMRGEFIKRTFVYGYEIPRHHLQYMGAERREKYSDTMEWLRSTRSKFSLMMSRGSSPVFLRKFFLFIFLIRAQERSSYFPKVDRVKKGKKKKRPKRIVDIVYYPPIGLFTPVSLGGVGCTLNNSSGTSTDMFCAYQAIHNDTLLKAVNRFANLLVYTKSDIVSVLTSTAVNEGVYIDGIQTAIPGLDYIRTNVRNVFPQRLLNSRLAANRLRKSGVKIVPRDMLFENIHEAIVQRELKNARQSRQIAFDYDQRLKTRALSKNRIAETDLLGRDYGWLRLVNFEIEEYKAEEYPHPFICCHNNVMAAYRSVGVRLDRTVNSFLGYRLTALLRSYDRYFPRHHDPTRLLSILTSNECEDIEVLTDVLMALGMRPDVAGFAATNLLSNQSEVHASLLNGGYSWGDAMYANFASLRVMNILEGTNSTPDVRVRDLLDSVFTHALLGLTINTGVTFVGRISFDGIMANHKIIRSLGLQKRLIYEYNRNLDHEYHGIVS